MTAIDDISAGVYDGQLGDVIAVVLDRLVETQSTLSWRITLDGESWDIESVTLRELAAAEDLARTSYLTFDPLRQVSHLVALIVAHFMVVDHLKVEVAFERAGKYTASDLKSIVSVYETGAVGKDGGLTSTDS